MYQFSSATFFCELFYDSENSSEYTVLNGKMTYDDDLEKIWYKEVMA